MSNETKNKTAADTVAENVQAVAEAVATNAASAVEVAKAAAAITEEMTSAAGLASEAGKVAAAVAGIPDKKFGKGKQQAKGITVTSTGTSALKSIGLAACKRHSLKAVWVTEDGQCFDQESNARAHGKNLKNHEPLKVEA